MNKSEKQTMTVTAINAKEGSVKVLNNVFNINTVLGYYVFTMEHDEKMEHLSSDYSLSIVFDS